MSVKPSLSLLMIARNLGPSTLKTVSPLAKRKIIGWDFEKGDLHTESKRIGPADK